MKVDQLSGWVEKTLADIVAPRGEKSLPKDYPHLPFIGMDNVEAHTMKLLGKVDSYDLKSSAAHFYSKDVLYGRLRPYLNKVVRLDFEGLASAEFIVFPESQLIKSSFLKYRLNANDFVSYASHLNEGDRPRVSYEQIKYFKIQLPSPNEQDQIVRTIEELFSDLDNAIDNLKKAKEQLKVYRQSVLSKLLHSNVSEDYKGNWKAVRDIGEVVTGCTPSKKEAKYYGKEYPLYKPGDLNDGFMTTDSVDGLTKKGIKKARILPAKSVLVTCIGATIGKAGLIRKNGACNQQINAIIPANFVMSEYLYYFCISPEFQEQIKTNASSTTLPILNKSKFEKLMVFVPSLDEQAKIVQEIELNFSLCSKIEGTIDDSLKQVQSLRQSILKKAFEGKLTEKWREEHPELITGKNSVKVLLEKIKSTNKEDNVNKERVAAL